MEIIPGPLHSSNESLARVPLPVDRLTLVKRRWRGTAVDGTEFGFDLDHPLTNGDVFFQTATALYQIEQAPEAVLELPLPDPENAARLAWKIGNLHFPIAVLTGSILAPDDLAIRQMLEREKIAYRAIEAVFNPLQGAHSHGSHSH